MTQNYKFLDNINFPSDLRKIPEKDLQKVSDYLLWTGLPGIGRALGADNVKFFGQVLPSAEKVNYKLDIKRVINRGAIVGLADGEMSVDGRKIYSAEKLKVGLFKDPSNF